MAGRSSIERLPPGILAEVHEAIREGATIDEIVRRIPAQGGTCSRSAVCRYVRRARAVLQRRREVDGLADLWLGTPGNQCRKRFHCHQSGSSVVDLISSIDRRAVTSKIFTCEISAW